MSLKAEIREAANLRFAYLRGVSENRMATSKNRKIFPMIIRAVLLVCCCIVLIPNMPVNCLELSSGGEVLFAAPLSMGTSFTTVYIHSVQLTPVVDEYKIVKGKIWGWEERIKSHNAGLPFSAPPNGRFLVEPSWMIVQGGRLVQDRIVYRVGDEKLGRNTWSLPPFEMVKIYEAIPWKRVFIDASIKKLSEAPLIGWRTKASTQSQ